MATYGLLKRRVTRALVREDIDAEEFDCWVRGATQRLNEELRILDMLARATIPYTKPIFSVPPDFIAVHTIRVRSAEGRSSGPLLYATPEALADFAARETAPAYYTSYGRSLEIAPFRVADGSNLEMRYYRELPQMAPVDASTNFILSKYPDLYFNTVLVSGYRFYFESEKAQETEGYVALEIGRLNDRKQMEKYGDGPLVAQPSRKLGGRHS